MKKKIIAIIIAAVLLIGGVITIVACTTNDKPKTETNVAIGDNSFMIMQGYTHHEIRKMLQLPETTYFRHFAKIREAFKKNPFFFKNSGSK